MDISKTVFVRDGREWSERFTDTDPATVYKSLSQDLLQKRFYRADYIKSLKCSNNFNGTYTITVYYSNNTKSRYIVER